MDLQQYIIASSRNQRSPEEEKEIKSFEKIHPNLSKQWVGMALGYNEYSDGVTGVRFFGRIVLEDRFNGFRLKSEIKKTLKSHGIRIGKMEKVGDAMDGGIRRKGWDMLELFKVPEMISFIKERKNDHRLAYSEWKYHGPIFPVKEV